MANKKNRVVLWTESLLVKGTIKSIVSFFILVFIGCASPPPIRPALDQTVINVQRSSTRLDTGKLYILVDDLYLNKGAPIKKGQFVTYPINNGVHYIHGICERPFFGKLVSEAINFTANSKTVSFIATVEKAGFFGKKKLVITRSEVGNDTGSQTDLDIQESYGNVQ
jgi:hypothetical protein